MKLKTLKDFGDIEIETYEHELIQQGMDDVKENLRKEAVKWLKKFNRTGQAWCLDCNEDPLISDGVITEIQKKCLNHRTFWNDFEEYEMMMNFFDINAGDIK